MNKFWEDYWKLCKDSGNFYKEHWKGCLVLNAAIIGAELAWYHKDDIVGLFRKKSKKEFEVQL